MLVLGDVFAVVSILAGVFLTAYALLMGLNFAFEDEVQDASERLNHSKFHPLLLGTLVGLPLTIVTLVLMGQPLPLLKFLGVIGVLLILIVALTGMAAVCRSFSNQITKMEPSMGKFAALSRATFIIVGATLFPVVGWLFVAPILVLMGFGLAAPTFVKRDRPVEVV